MEARASAVAVGGFRQGWERVGRMVFHPADVFPTEVELREDQGTLEDPPRIYAFVTTAMKLVLSVGVCPLRKTHWFDVGVIYDVVKKSIHRKFENEIMWLSLCIMRNHHARQGPFIWIEHYDRVGPYDVGFRDGWSSVRPDDPQMGSPNLAENDSLGDERRNDIQELARLFRQNTTSHEKFPKIKVPLFDDENVTDWLEKYELNAHVRQWTEWKMLEVVKRYVHVDLAEEVDEEDRIVYTNIRGEVFDFEGNLIDSYIEGGMRKEAFRCMNRTMPCTYRLVSKEEMKILESREAARQTVVSRPDVSKGKTENERAVRKALSSRSGLKAFGGQVMRLGLDMEKIRLGMPNMFLLGGHDGRRGMAPLAASLSALRAERPSSSHLQTASAGTHSVLNRPILRRGTSPAVPQAQKIKKGNQPRVAPIVSAKAQQEAPVVIVEEDLDTEDEKLRAEDERQARLRAQKRGLDENQDKEKDEGEEEEHQKKKNRYTISIEEGIDIEKMVDRILESHRDLVTLKEFLAASPKIREELKQRLTRWKVMTVKLGDVIPPEANLTPAGAKMDWRCVATGHVMVKIGVSQHLALVDTGAEMNILKEKEALELGIEIDRTDNEFLVGAGGSTPFCGTASNMFDFEVERIASVKNRADGLSRIDWDNSEIRAEDSVPVDGFLEIEEGQRSINSYHYLVDASYRQGRSMWNGPNFYQVRPELVKEESFIEEDPWGERSGERMMSLALSDSVRLSEDPLSIQEGFRHADEVLRVSGGTCFVIRGRFEGVGTS
ncbi:hypothetical protein CBR_g19582 [Chara braunii]|uniref:Peptidase A2 domain-containing protein n=1 Tax=Chara braunii TaxID=69332 RepID=A0A388KYD6_CHABU|nr:hypothetical protein CBR_g19582 [Chara braunii]|eukprot:GBG75069.1 hypothetical protein CBR_g19582 [Chara braunii]